MTKFELDLLKVLEESIYENEDYIEQIPLVLFMQDRGYYQNVNDDMSLGEAITMYEKLLYKGSEK